jgi:hypothetical protein
MGTKLSIEQMLAQLEGQVAHHRQRQEEHARQEAFHREKKDLHAAELTVAVERLEGFRNAASLADELVERHRATTAPPPPRMDPIPEGSRRPIRHVVARVIASFRPEDTFSATDVAREANRHYGAMLRETFDGRAISVTLRRLAARGQLKKLREGTPHHPALYTRNR